MPLSAKANPVWNCKGCRTIKFEFSVPLSSLPRPPSMSKLICEGRVDRANRNSTVQISYPRFPRAQRLAKQVSDRLLRARGMSLQRDENIFENSHLGAVPSRPRSRGEKSRNFRAARLRLVPCDFLSARSRYRRPVAINQFCRYAGKFNIEINV